MACQQMYSSGHTIAVFVERPEPCVFGLIVATKQLFHPSFQQTVTISRQPSKQAQVSPKFVVAACSTHEVYLVDIETFDCNQINTSTLGQLSSPVAGILVVIRFIVFFVDLLLDRE
jgi:hypothetical protein